MVILGMFIYKETVRPKDSDNPADEMFSMANYDVVSSTATEYEGYLNEGDNYRYDHIPPMQEGDLLRLIRVSLRWTDEPDIADGHTQYDNEPDRFYLVLKWQSQAPGDDTVLIGSAAGQNLYDGEGLIQFHILLTHYSADSTDGMGAWNVTVHMVSAGDHIHPSEKIPNQPDDGNAYQLNVEVEIYRPK